MNFKLLRTLKGIVILSLLFCASSYAQVKKITGKVTDSSDGGALPGVNVSIKGKPSNVSTNSDGVYTIQADPEVDVLVFSYIGFTRQTITLGGKVSLNVSLAPDNESLNEVEIVQVGYGAQKKVSLTHAIETIDMKAIQDIPVGSLVSALRGQVAGVSVTGGQSRTGQNANVTIRQPRILSKDGGTTDPIFIIDDVVKSSAEFNLLDQTEVESITVLKDAAAAIYGVNGNQGAILVRTKRGQIGMPKVSYSGSMGVTDATMLSKMMSGYDQAKYLNTYNYTEGKYNNPAFNWDGASKRYTEEELDHFKNFNYNWLDMGWKSSTINRHTVNVSGGADKATYFASVAYNTQDANLDNINSDRWTYRASSDITLASGLKVGLQLSGDIYNNKAYWLKQGGESIEKDVLALLQTPQFNPPYINGFPVNLSGATNSTTENFHFFEVQKGGDYTKTRNAGLNVNINVDYKIPFIQGLSARAFYNQRSNNSFGKQYGTSYNVYTFSMLGNKHIYGGDIIGKTLLKNGSMLRFNPTYEKNYQLNGSLNFDRSFGKHNISALAMVEQRESYADGIASFIEDPILGGTDNKNYFYGAAGLQSESESESGYLSYISRLNYNYADTYLFEMTLRADASTNFAPEHRWGYFPSFSAGWVISNESFFKDNVKFMDFLKIRSALGFVGGDRTRAYQWYDRYRREDQKGAIFGGDNVDRSFIFNQNGISNRNVVWDNATKFSVGLETKFFKERLSLTIDGYQDRFNNMLTQLTSSVSLLVGAALPSENYSEIKTFGTEISLGWNDRIGKDWSYRVNSFFSWYDDKNILRDISAGDKGTMRDVTGRSSDLGVYGYKYAGFFRTQDQVDAFRAEHPDYRIFGEIPRPGMLYYEDVSGKRNGGGDLTPLDGTITEDDQTYLTKRADNHFGLGFNFSVAYKAFSLGVTSGISWGGMSSVEGDARAKATATVNKPAFWADHWTEDNTNAQYPNPFYTQTYTVLSDFWFRSSTSINISNLNLGYTFPKNMTSTVGINSARVFVVATNPFDIYNPYKDYRARSGSYNVYPVLKTWSFGLNVGF